MTVALRKLMPVMHLGLSMARNLAALMLSPNHQIADPLKPPPTIFNALQFCPTAPNAASAEAKLRIVIGLVNVRKNVSAAALMQTVLPLTYGADAAAPSEPAG